MKTYEHDNQPVSLCAPYGDGFFYRAARKQNGGNFRVWIGPCLPENLPKIGALITISPLGSFKVDRHIKIREDFYQESGLI